MVATLLILLFAVQEAPVSKESASLYRAAVEHGFARTMERRFFRTAPVQIQRIDRVTSTTEVPPGGILAVAGDVSGPVSVGEGAMLEVGGSVSADLVCARDGVVFIRGGIARGTSVTLDQGELIVGGSFDGMIAGEGSTAMLFAGENPSPDQIAGKASGDVVLSHPASPEDERLWFRSHPDIRLIARGSASADLHFSGDSGRILRVAGPESSLHRALAAFPDLPSPLLRPFGDEKLRKTIDVAREDSDGGRRIRIPSSASVTWFSAIKADVTIRERLGVTVIAGDLPAGRTVRVNRVDGALDSLIIVTGDLKGTLDLGIDRRTRVAIGGDVRGVLLAAGNEVAVLGSILKEATIEPGQKGSLRIFGSAEEEPLLRALEKSMGTTCVLGRGSRAGRTRTGSALLFVLETRP